MRQGMQIGIHEHTHQVRLSGNGLVQNGAYDHEGLTETFIS